MSYAPTPLDSALRLARHAFRVFPVGRAQKRPLITEWNTKAATSDPAEIERLWGEKFPDANVGVSCGPSDLVVVDVDPRHGGMDSLGRLFLDYGDDWVRTVTAKTGGGGLHLYLRAEGKRYGNTTGTEAGGIAPGIDTRAIGGFVVAPYSIHMSGNVYEWEPEYSPDDRPVLPVPTWLAELMPAAPKQRTRAEKVKTANQGRQEQATRGDLQVVDTTCSP